MSEVSWAEASNASVDRRPRPQVPTGVPTSNFSHAARVFLDDYTSTTSRSSDADVRRQFRNHADIWKRDMLLVSSLDEKYLHPSYARIIGMGLSAVPLILRSLEDEPDDWFYALRAITGTDVVREADAGNIANMSAAWIAWGRSRGLI